jgi:hypothetical protein
VVPGCRVGGIAWSLFPHGITLGKRLLDGIRRVAQRQDLVVATS